MFTTTHQPSDNVVQAAPEEKQALEQLRHQIDEIFRRHRTARPVDPDGETTEIPESVFHALKFVVKSMARGQTITLYAARQSLHDPGSGRPAARLPPAPDQAA